ncbi:hypothetical protein EYF80_013868 [Liparis tanakae]|uniref:Uncharacterized protein n=1 Tax=Liparis tanakae TaxID=230148 RepID=A0A4Z2ID41_9TELE|nr:hypothetical protein EYF80_013868 [Liparis tanakae]
MKTSRCHTTLPRRSPQTSGRVLCAAAQRPGGRERGNEEGNEKDVVTKRQRNDEKREREDQKGKQHRRNGNSQSHHVFAGFITLNIGRSAHTVSERSFVRSFNFTNVPIKLINCTEMKPNGDLDSRHYVLGVSVAVPRQQCCLCGRHVSSNHSGELCGFSCFSWASK